MHAYIDPDQRDMAVRTIEGQAFRAQRLYNGRPARFQSKRLHVFASNEHGEGLPHPSLYLGQLMQFSDSEIKAVMSDNLARFLDLV